MELELLERAGVIRDLACQVPFVLQDKYTSGDGRKIRELKYVVDFVYTDVESGGTVVEDVKGYRTEIYKIKKKLFEQRYHPLTIREV